MASGSANQIDSPDLEPAQVVPAAARQLLDGLQCPAGLLQEQTVLGWNQALEKLLNLADLASRKSALEELLIDRSDSNHPEAMFFHKRSRKWLSLSRSTLQLQPALTLYIVHDWSSLREAWGLVQQGQEALLNSSKFLSVGEMATTLAHEINQPLAAIVNYLNVAKRAIGSAGQMDPLAPLQEAAQQTDRASAIVRRIREFVQNRQPRRDQIEPAELVQGAVAAIQSLADQFRLRIGLEIAESLSTVEGDRVMLEQVLVNFLKNAIEAVGSITGSAQVSVAASKNLDGQIEILVIDNGPGLAQGMHERLFQPFATSKSSGMGVGLSICRSILEYHQGRVFYRPNPTGGSIFGLTLPPRNGA